MWYLLLHWGNNTVADIQMLKIYTLERIQVAMLATHPYSWGHFWHTHTHTLPIDAHFPSHLSCKEPIAPFHRQNHNRRERAAKHLWLPVLPCWCWFMDRPFLQICTYFMFKGLSPLCPVCVCNYFWYFTVYLRQAEKVVRQM